MEEERIHRKIESNRNDERLRDLTDIIHFTEKVSARIHGVLDETEIYKIVRDEFANSKRYNTSILLLTDDESKLRIVGASALSPRNLKAAEKASGIRLKGFKIDLNKSTIYNQVVNEGKTVQVNISDTISELFPRSLARLIIKTMGYKGKKSIITPLKRHGKIIGAFAMSSTELAEYFIPSVKNLAQHISTGLDLADERAERKQAEERYRDLIEKEKDIIYTLDCKGNITFSSPAVKTILGYQPEELSGKNFMVLIPKERQERTGDDFNNLLKTGEITAETVLLDKKRQSHFVEYSSTVIKEGGKVVGTRGIVRDITERKQTEEEIIRTKEYLQNIIDSASEVIISFDKNNRVNTWNNAAEFITGYKRREVIGRKINRLNVFDNPSKVAYFIKSVSDGNKDDVNELILKTYVESLN